MGQLVVRLDLENMTVEQLERTLAWLPRAKLVKKARGHQDLMGMFKFGDE